MDTAVVLQLHLEDQKDWSRQNNLWLQGVPEATGTEKLAETITAIFHTVFGSPLTSLEQDRVQRALGPSSSDPSRPRDVICHTHHYTKRETILRSAWEHGDVDFDGATVKILPDLSRATLQRRALFSSILDLARQLGCTYR